MYPSSYHRALNSLIGLNIMAPSARIRIVRGFIARALRDLRKTFDSDRVRRERDHMIYINGTPWVRCARGAVQAGAELDRELPRVTWTPGRCPALTRAINRAIAEGAPVIEEQVARRPARRGLADSKQRS